VRTTLAVLAVTGLVLAPLPTSSTAQVATAAPGVCSGVSGCIVKAHVDVDGDGHKDAVGLASRGHGASRRVIVRVKTSADHIVTVRPSAAFWIGPFWQGATLLDGRPGHEIVVGQTMGAHAQLYRALTWRGNGLRILQAPGRGRYWMIDRAVWISNGWQRRAVDGAGMITRRAAERVGDTTSPFKGRLITYQWDRDGWTKVRSKTVYPLPDRRANAWGGFDVPGLARW
jgi:hypothetical protein